MEQKKSTKVLKLEYILSSTLKGGLYLSILISVCGAALLLINNGYHTFDFSQFKGEPRDLSDLPALMHEILNGDPLAIIQLGIFVLILNPILRVLTCLILFIYEKDFLYIVLASIVFAILLYSIL